LDLADAAHFPDDFLGDQGASPPQERRLFRAASQEKQDRWLSGDRSVIDEKIRRGIE
jgi:hypothetical protein